MKSSMCYSKLVKDTKRTKCLKSSSSFYRNVTISLKRNQTNNETYMTDSQKPIWECHKLDFTVKLVL